MTSSSFLRSSSALDTDLKSLIPEGSVVLAHGVFDLFHYGHLLYLQEAKSQGDFLVVSVTDDPFVNKGPGRPVFSGHKRCELLSALEIVDLVILSESETAIAVIEAVKPDIYFKGADYSDPENDISGNLRLEQDAVEKWGGQLVTGTSPLWSSSKLINDNLSNRNGVERQWISTFKESFELESVVSALGDIQGLRVVVVGEAIIDEYTSVRGLGKSSKHPVLAFEELDTEVQFGGAIAIARHVQGLGSDVRLVSTMNSVDFTKLAESGILKSDALTTVASSNDITTVTKRRFVDIDTNSYVFETYRLNLVDGLTMEEELLANLENCVEEADVLLVVDYGHGLLTPKIRESLRNSKCFVAVNAQANAGNRGVNSVSKYADADLVCMNGREVEMELRGVGPIRSRDLESIRDTTRAEHVLVTEGKRGLAILSGGEFLEVPAFASEAKDPVGAGDAVLAVSGLMFSRGIAPEIVGLVCNLAGAEIVRSLGNRSALSSAQLRKHAEVLLK